MNFNRLFGTLAIASAALTFPAYAAAAETGMSADSGTQAHSYIYYPAKAIYLDPARKLWFWNEDGTWHGEAMLPGHLQQWTTKGHTVSLDTERPYDQQAAMEKRYGKQIRYEQTAEYRAMLNVTRQASR
ncbi:MAG TPA: hypothetical protein VM074_06525 [Solimonas sp.]|nr:hypothetical protein [Solimonas sp.]